MFILDAIVKDSVVISEDEKERIRTMVLTALNKEEIMEVMQAPE